jgi:hypothetical protein
MNHNEPKAIVAESPKRIFFTNGSSARKRYRQHTEKARYRLIETALTGRKPKIRDHLLAVT